MLTYDQLRRSWYMFFFQNPLADLAVGLDDLEFIARLWQDWSPGYDAAERRRPRARRAGRSRPTWPPPSATTGPCSSPSSRCPSSRPRRTRAAAPTPQPTLYLHGADDGCMAASLAEGALAYLPAEGSRVEIVADAGHFLQLEQPEVVNRADRRAPRPDPHDLAQP